MVLFVCVQGLRGLGFLGSGFWGLGLLVLCCKTQFVKVLRLPKDVLNASQCRQPQAYSIQGVVA